MDIMEAIGIVEDALENHWLNLHESPYQEDADKFEEAWKQVKVVAKEENKLATISALKSPRGFSKQSRRQ